jgi:hypothetical protein
MVDVTTPDGIVKWTQTDAASIIDESQDQGDSIQAAFDKRQRYDYVWPTATERGSQTGMTQGSRGYQVDTKSEWIYDSSNWRLAASYFEGTASTGALATASAIGVGTITTNSSNTTDTSFVNLAGSQTILVNPGIYSIQLTGKENGSNPCTGQSQLVISTASTFADVPGRKSNGMFSGALMATCVLPFFRTTAANTNVYYYFYNDSGASRTMNVTISVGRIA